MSESAGFIRPPTIGRPLDYARAVVARRGLVWHLALATLKARTRRTHLGVLWLALEPFFFTVVLTLVFAGVFNRPWREFSIFVLSGVITWEWFAGHFTIAAHAMIVARPYIRQQRNPNVVYALKTVIHLFLVYLIGLVALAAWTLMFRPDFFSPLALVILPNLLFAAICLAPWGILASLLGAVFGDFPQVINVPLRAVWFVSPIFIDKTVFAGGRLKAWDDFNPVSNLLDLVRTPLMELALPSWQSYGVVAAFGLVGLVLAVVALARLEARIVYFV